MEHISGIIVVTDAVKFALHLRVELPAPFGEKTAYQPFELQ
jgi:hypothetical protein